jgi:Domain of unknown function (DUF4918)
VKQRFAQKAIRFNEELNYNGDSLPSGIRMMNPFRESALPLQISRSFYEKYYDDYNPRHLILGINPGRFGAGQTGIPFTDPKRLISECRIEYSGKITHEPSSVFIYEMIQAYGGVQTFYHDFYINSVCPLGFTSSNNKGREKNYNYYDSRELMESVGVFITENMHTLIGMGVNTDICFCFGTGRNEKFLKSMNNQYTFFKKIISLEHPRFIMQYKSKDRHVYIEKYLKAFAIIRESGG